MKAGIDVEGTVTEHLANHRYRVLLETGQQVILYAAGKLHKAHIVIVPGDKVMCELCPYNLTQGRILFRQQ